jgi:tight adherence protein C
MFVSRESAVYIFAILVTVSVATALLGVVMLLRPSRVDKRMRSLYLPGQDAGWASTVTQLVGPFAKLSLPEGDWENSLLRQRFLHAGIRRADARLLYFGLKSVLPMVAGSVAWLALRQAGMTGLMPLLLTLLAALAGTYAPNIALAMMVRSRQRDIFESFPDAADLMLVCVEAGHGLDAAMQRIADEMRHKSLAMAEELYLTNLELRAGAGRNKAMRNMARRTGIEEVGAFAAMLTQADKFGSSIGDSLRVFSDDLRHKRLIRAEELAAKVPTKMLLPLVLFIFPSVIAVILGPALITIIRTIPGLLGHA